MGQQTIPGSFRAVDPAQGLGQLNLADVTSAQSSVSRWTTGATQINIIPTGVPLGQSWTVVSWYMNFYGVLNYLPILPGQQNCGKLGKLTGGLTTSVSGPTAGSAGLPYVTPMSDLPDDQSMLTTLWDGDSESAFPALQTVVGSPVKNVRSGGLQLPVPLTLRSGDTLAIGLWLSPSLTQNIQTLIYNTRYSIVYDDGIVVPPGKM